MIELPEMSELTFNAKDHTYKLSGFALPSVTQIMAPLSSVHYDGISAGVLQVAAARGTEVHAAVEDYILYGVDDVSDENRGYFNAFKDWQSKHEFEAVAAEKPVYNKLYRYAGTADIICVLDGELTLVDLKTTSGIIDMMTRVQLEAYRQAFKTHGVDIKNKMILLLSKNGKCTERRYGSEDSEAWRVFTECCDIRNYISKNKK